MAYNIKLFVHGVPNGQDIWGNPGEDAKYIEAFYGRKSNVPSQMFLEVMQFGGETNAYYTYFYYHDKIQDSTNRTGGYFALTLRINYYYADIQNIYNLLEAAFNKFVIGSVMEYTAGGGCRFMIPHFIQANDNFKALEKELQHYLMQFSSNKDFISLGAFKSNGQNDFSTINLLEAIPNVVANHVKSTGKISVSSFHPSSKEQQIINKMNAEMQNVTLNAQQQIVAAQEKAKQDILSAQRDKEQRIQSIKNEYKDADKTISQLRAQNDKVSKEIGRLSAQINELNVKLQNAQVYKSRYEENERKLEKTEKLIADIKKNLSGLSGISELLGVSSIASVPSGEDRKTGDKTKGILSVIKKIHPFTDFFVMVVLLGIIGTTLPKSCDSKDISDTSMPASADITKGSSQVAAKQVEKVVEEGTPDSTTTSTNVDSPEVQETVESLRAKYPKARIDVTNIDEARGRFMQVNSGLNYQLSVLNVSEELHGKWECDTNALIIHDNNIIPKSQGAHMITYKVKGEIYLRRTITVK